MAVPLIATKFYSPLPRPQCVARSLLAEPQGFLRLFVDEGEAMRSLIAD